jgi:spermidine/putrescine transport system permease protein
VTLWNDDAMQACMQNSLIVGALATLMATVIGTLAALAMSRPGSFRGKAATSAALYLPIIIPEIVVGAALLTFFSFTSWHLSLLTVVIAHVAFSVSYVAIVVKARLAGFDRSLEEAAMDLGAGKIGTFFRVKLPLMMPGIIAAALLVFTLSIDDYVITSFVAGSQSQTLPLLIASKLHVKNDLPVVNAAATILLLLTVALIVTSQWLLAEKKSSS